MCRELGIETGVDPRIASGFAGGIGNTGSVCGAVAGGVMALGLGLPRREGLEGLLQNLSVAGELRRRFEEEAGALHCAELTGADLTSPEGIERYMSSDAPMMVCVPAVSAASRLALELLREEAGPPAAPRTR